MKTIVFCTTGLGLGGIEKVLIEVLKILNKDKYKIKLCIKNGDEDIFEDNIPENVEYRYLLPKDLLEKLTNLKKRKNFFSKLEYNHLLWKQKKVLEKNFFEFVEDADTVIDFYDGNFYKLFKKLKDVKKICWFHVLIDRLHIYKKGRFDKAIEYYDEFVTVSEELKERLVDKKPELKNKVRRIYNPFDFQVIKEKSKDLSMFSEKDRKLLEDKYLIAVSRLDTQQKDYYTLLKAFQKILERGFKNKLFIVGDGPDREKIEGWIKEFSLSDSVKLLGFQKNPYVWMRNAELFVHSSKYEGLPTVLIEAMNLGIPVVSTDCPTGPKEILLNGKCGVLTKIEDEKSLEEGMVSVLENIEESSKMVEKARLRIEEFGNSRVVECIEEIF